MELQRLLGGPEQHALGPSDLLSVEPALANAARGLVGAIYTPGECVADCRSVCEQLAARLVSRGVRFALGGRVTSFRVENDRVVAARIAREEIDADAFVVAAGTGSASLARLLGLRLPVYPLKGYSVTLDIMRADQAPQASITDAAHKIVLARVGSRLRVAGRAELVGHDLTVHASRARALAQAAQDLFPGACDVTNPRPWAGLRPATPTGLPIVGRMPGSPANLWFNTGHGALGFTLSFGTAVRLVQALTPRRDPRAAPAAPVARRA
jgi:D-amino-acid dehydrogenase